MDEDLNASIRPTLRDLGEWFRATRTQYVMIGAVAVSLVGRARTTKDVDAAIVVEDDELGAFIESGARFGFVPRIPDPIRLARSSCIVLMIHQVDGVSLDLALAKSAFEQAAIKYSVVVSAGDISVRVPRVEDLVIMKAVAGRPIDLGDIDVLLNMNPKANRRRIRRLASEFSEALDDAQIADRLEPLLAKRRVPLAKKKRRRGKN